MTSFANYRYACGSRPDKPFKDTLFSAEHMMLGLNCLEPGQVQAVHRHEKQDKFYFVLEGEGEFVVGEQVEVAGPGLAVWAPAGVGHGVTNSSDRRLVVLVGMAPPPS